MSEQKKSMSDDAAYVVETAKSLWLPAAGDYFAATGDFLLAAACKTVTGVWSAIDAVAQRKVNEFVELLREGQLSEADVRTEDFRSALKRTFDYWMAERKEEKRAIIRSIFLGFTQAADKSQFRIERMYSALDALELNDIIALRRLKALVIEPNHSQIMQEYSEQKARHEAEGVTPETYTVEHKRNGFSFKQNVANEATRGLIEGFDNLIREGIVKKHVREASSLPTFQDPAVNPANHSITLFGLEFCEFVEAEK